MIETEIGEHGELIIPKGAIRLSLDPSQGTGQFTEIGLSWFIANRLYRGIDGYENNLPGMLDGFLAEARDVINANSTVADALSGTDLDYKVALDEVFKKFPDQWNTPECWAIRTGQAVTRVQDALAAGNIDDAVWAMADAAMARAMLAYAGPLQQIIWRGYRVSELLTVLNVWEANKGNDDEDFWQRTLTEHSIVLSQVFSFPFIILGDKAYVGGKRISNAGGSLVDYLLKNSLTDNTALIEIKTPKTKLLGREYRSGSFSISADLSGAVVQASGYKDKFLKSYSALADDPSETFQAFNPQTLVIAGSIDREIRRSRTKLRSFDLFRHGLRDVQVITFDELFQKVRILADLLRIDLPADTEPSVKEKSSKGPKDSAKPRPPKKS